MEVAVGGGGGSGLGSEGVFSLCYLMYVGVFVFVNDTCELPCFEGAVAVTPAAYLSIVKNIIFLCVCVCCVLEDAYDLSHLELLHVF